MGSKGPSYGEFWLLHTGVCHLHVECPRAHKVFKEDGQHGPRRMAALGKNPKREQKRKPCVSRRASMMIFYLHISSFGRASTLASRALWFECIY